MIYIPKHSPIGSVAANIEALKVVTFETQTVKRKFSLILRSSIINQLLFFFMFEFDFESDKLDFFFFKDIFKDTF